MHVITRVLLRVSRLNKWHRLRISFKFMDFISTKSTNLKFVFLHMRTLSLVRTTPEMFRNVLLVMHKTEPLC